MFPATVTVLKEFLYILAVPSTTIAGLFALTSWWSALLYFSAIAAFAIFAVVRSEKHRHFQPLDDRLSVERMESAREWLQKD